MLVRRNSLLAMLCMCTIAARGQSMDYLDSLLAVFDTARQDTDRLQVLSLVAEFSGRKAIGDKYHPLMEELVERLAKDRDAATRSIAEHGRIRSMLWAGRLRSRATDYPSAVRYFHRASVLAEERKDTAALSIHGYEMSALYLQLGDTANAVRSGYRSAELALARGDSLYGVDLMLGTSRIDTSMARMTEAVALADRFYTHGRAGREYYLWTRAWTLTAHEQHSAAIADLIMADSLLAGRDDAYRGLVNWTLGEAYQRASRSNDAIRALRACISLSIEHPNDHYHAGCAAALGDEEFKLAHLAAAESAWREAAHFAHRASAPEYELRALDGLRKLYTRQERYKEALDIARQWTTLRDSMARMDATKDLLRLEFNAEQRADSLLHVQQQEAAAYQLQRERNNRNLLIAGAVVAVVFGSISYRQRRRTQKALKRSDELLLNILPEEVAEELKETGAAEAVHLDQVTVLFTDFKGFTEMSGTLSAQELVRDLHECFSAFDRISEKHGIEKIKTIGDAYMAAGGLPTPNTTHAVDVIQAAVEMRDFIAEGKARKVAAGLPYFEIRIGIHTGPVVAGIVGVKKFQYDIWGDTVNTAARMESSGEVGKVNISEATYALVKDLKNEKDVKEVVDGNNPQHATRQPATEPAFAFTPRGKVQAKGKGEMEMYFVERTTA